MSKGEGAEGVPRISRESVRETSEEGPLCNDQSMWLKILEEKAFSKGRPADSGRQSPSVKKYGYVPAGFFRKLFSHERCNYIPFELSMKTNDA